MTRRTIVAVIVLLLILGLIYVLQRGKNNDKKTSNQVILSASASSPTANKGDIVTYTLNVENPGNKIVPGYIVEANISDLQELSTLIDAEGANYNPATGSLIWTPIDVPKKGSIQKKISVKVKDELPASSDMVMSLKFGNETTVAVVRSDNSAATPGAGGNPDAPRSNTGSSPGSTKGAAVSYNSPKTGPSEWLSLILALFSTAGFTLFRFKRKLA